MMKNAWKRTTALILAMAMCLGLLSANVWAAGVVPQAEKSSSARSSTETAPEEEIPAGEESAPQEETAPVKEIASDQSTPEEYIPAEKSATDGEEASLAPQGVVDSGTCGDNLTWTMDDRGTLTISGTGEMDGWDFCPPWSEYLDSIRSAVIASGVTSISWGAFGDCSRLKSVSIPASVTSIGEGAFEGTPWLKSLGDFAVINGILLCYQGNEVDVTIPASVTSIGAGAFLNYTSLTNVTIPNSVTSVSL